MNIYECCACCKDSYVCNDHYKITVTFTIVTCHKPNYVKYTHNMYNSEVMLTKYSSNLQLSIYLTDASQNVVNYSYHIEVITTVNKMLLAVQ